jgi:hypothetical protein
MTFRSFFCKKGGYSITKTPFFVKNHGFLVLQKPFYMEKNGISGPKIAIFELIWQKSQFMANRLAYFSIDFGVPFWGHFGVHFWPLFGDPLNPISPNSYV